MTQRGIVYQAANLLLCYPTTELLDRLDLLREALAGTGLAHLRAMAEGLGGILEAASLDDRRFQVSARLPVLSHTTAPPALDQEGQR